MLSQWQPLLLNDVLFEELPKHVDFATLLQLAQTCQRFAVIWPRFVLCFPSYLDRRITDARLACFSSLTSLQIYDNTMMTDAGISRLTSLTSLSLDFNSRITDAGIAPLSQSTYYQCWYLSSSLPLFTSTSHQQNNH